MATIVSAMFIFLIALILAIFPGVFLISLLTWIAEADRDKIRSVVILFFLGVLTTFTAGELNGLGDRLFGVDTFGDYFIYESFGLKLSVFLYAAANEEIHKFLPVFLMVYYSRCKFTRPIDGILYCGAASMGFATLENIHYVLHFGFNTAFTRMFLSVPGHCYFAMMVGYFFGLAKYRNDREDLPWYGLGIATLFHAFYNTGLSVEREYLGGFIWFVWYGAMFAALYVLYLHRVSEDGIPIIPVLRHWSLDRRDRLAGADGLTILNSRSIRQADIPDKTQFKFPREWQPQPWPPPELRYEVHRDDLTRPYDPELWEEEQWS